MEKDLEFLLLKSSLKFLSMTSLGSRDAIWLHLNLNRPKEKNSLN